MENKTHQNSYPILDANCGWQLSPSISPWYLLYSQPPWARRWGGGGGGEGLRNSGEVLEVGAVGVRGGIMKQEEEEEQEDEGFGKHTCF